MAMLDDLTYEISRRFIRTRPVRGRLRPRLVKLYHDMPDRAFSMCHVGAESRRRTALAVDRTNSQRSVRADIAAP